MNRRLESLIDVRARLLSLQPARGIRATSGNPAWENYEYALVIVDGLMECEADTHVQFRECRQRSAVIANAFRRELRGEE